MPRPGRWQTWEPLGWLGQDLAGRTLGIVGMGRIGFAVAKRLHHGWGMKVLYTEQFRDPKRTRISARSASTSTQLLARERLRLGPRRSEPDDEGHVRRGSSSQKMKRTAVFVNTARGPLVDQKALAEALRSGTIFAAGLDVTDPEPLPPDHELYKLPNCVIVPHIASATVGTRNAMARLCANNLLAGVRGEPASELGEPGGGRQSPQVMAAPTRLELPPRRARTTASPSREGCTSKLFPPLLGTMTASRLAPSALCRPIEECRMIRSLIVLVTLGLASIASATNPKDSKPDSVIGTKAPAPNLTALDGKAVNFDTLRGKTATVVVFISFECPVSNSYAEPSTKSPRARPRRA